jgi:hypothetical protein
MFGIIENHGRTGTFAPTVARYGLRYDVDFDFDFNILTALIRLGRAGPDRGRVPSIIVGLVPSLLLFELFFDFDPPQKIFLIFLISGKPIYHIICILILSCRPARGIYGAGESGWDGPTDTASSG